MSRASSSHRSLSLSHRSLSEWWVFLGTLMAGLVAFFSGSSLLPPAGTSSSKCSETPSCFICSSQESGTLITSRIASEDEYISMDTSMSQRQVPIGFLERIKEDFTKKYGGGKAATAVANSLKKEFGPKLKEQMQYCVDHPEKISKLSKVKSQVSEVKGVMMENIEKVLDRGEKIEVLVDKTENLRSQAQDFRTHGTQIRRKMWLQNMKIKLIVWSVVFIMWCFVIV